MATRNVSFYGQGQRAPLGGGQIQSAYQDDPRRQIAQNLMQSGSSTAPVQSVTEGIARALSGAAGGYFAGEARRDTEAKEADRRKKMSDVLSSISAPVEAAPALNVPAEFADLGAAITRDPTATEQQQRLVDGVSTFDPDQGLSMRAALMQSQIAAQQAAEAAQIAREQQLGDLQVQRDFQMKLKRTAPGAAPTAPVPGRDVPFSDAVANQRRDLAKAGGSNVNVNSAGQPTNPMLEAAGKGVSGTMADWTSKGREAYGFVSQIGDLRNILSSGVKTGFGQEFKNDATRMMSSVGIEIDAANMDAAQLTTSIINQLVVPRVKQLGAKPTDRDLQFIVDQFPKISNQEGGNDLILEVLELSGKRDIAREKFVTKWLKENAINDPNGLNFSADYEKFISGNNLFKPFSPQVRDGDKEGDDLLNKYAPVK